MKLKTLNSIYPDDLVFEISQHYDFDMTTVTGRSQYFNLCWNNWEQNEVVLSGEVNELAGSMYQVPAGRFNKQLDNAQQRFREHAEENGLKEFWDFIIKGRTVRFKNSDDALYYRLSS